MKAQTIGMRDAFPEVQPGRTRCSPGIFYDFEFCKDFIFPGKKVSGVLVFPVLRIVTFCVMIRLYLYGAVGG